MTNLYDQKVGEIIRVEWNQETDEVRIIMDITDSSFKRRVLHNKDLKDLITIIGKSVMRVASRR